MIAQTKIAPTYTCINSSTPLVPVKLVLARTHHIINKPSADWRQQNHSAANALADEPLLTEKIGLPCLTSIIQQRTAVILGKLCVVM